MSTGGTFSLPFLLLLLLLTSKLPHRCKTPHTMKPYPLGIDNPIKIKQVWGSTKWAIYWKEDFTKIATFNSEFQAFEARRSIIESL